MLISTMLVVSAQLFFLAGEVDWSQWGGPDRNFVVQAGSLADEWPAKGPKRLWSRELGVGYSGVVVVDGVLYTMYRKDRSDPDEYTVALSARTGETLWEHKNSAPLAGPPAEPPDSRWGGQGPNATPLVVGNRLYTIGSKAVLHARDRTNGRVLWKRDLAAEFGASRCLGNDNTGHSPSPIAYGDTIIVPIGRAASSRTDEDRSIVALDQVDGHVVWKSQDFQLGFSSPILIELDGKPQLVLHVRTEVLGIDPGNGQLLWKHPIPSGGDPIITPVWDRGRRVLVKEGGQGGTAFMIELNTKGGRTVPEEVWSTRDFPLFVPTPVRIGDHLYGSSEKFLIAVDAMTGKRVWLEREFPSASVVLAGGKLLLLDQEGQLTLATATPEGLTVHSQCQVTERYSLTAPTLVGKTLYIRDLKRILALDLE
jgi:outer membrane protein assembly factor BamB